MESLNRTELKALLRAEPNARYRLAYKVGFWHGLRASELCSMTREHILDGFVDVKRLKGSLRTVQRHVNFRETDPELDESAELEELARTLKPGERVFPITRFGLYKAIRRAGMKAGIARAADRCHPHVLKHSIAMQTIDVAGIQNVRQRLGHKSIASTGEYLKVNDDAAAQRIEAAMGVK